jgi:hypothetical protein
MAKKTCQNAIRVSSELFDLGRTMMSRRGAENFSDYVRGLLLLDAIHHSPDLVFGHDVPGWVTRDKRFEAAILRPRDGERA